MTTSNRKYFMNRFILHPAGTCVVLSLFVLFSSNAFAAKKSQEQLRYEGERAACMNGSSNQDRATCLREASAALQEARRGNLSGGDLARNAVRRCDGVPADGRDDCVKRQRGRHSARIYTDGGAQIGLGIWQRLLRHAGSGIFHAGAGILLLVKWP